MGKNTKLIFLPLIKNIKLKGIQTLKFYSTLN